MLGIIKYEDLNNTKIICYHNMCGNMDNKYFYVTFSQITINTTIKLHFIMTYC